MKKVEIEKIQDKLLEIAKYFDAFCKKNDVVYYLMGGSALGAVRHKGFIPWDDDFDVFMTYHNYIKFISACKKILIQRITISKKKIQKSGLYFFLNLE